MKLTGPKFRGINEDQISKLIDQPFNPPGVKGEFDPVAFEVEFNEFYRGVKRVLAEAGPLARAGEKGIDLGPPSLRDRSIGIVLTLKKYFKRQLLLDLHELVVATDTDYMIFINGEHAFGVDGFYICIMRDEIVGYAENAEALACFGFS